MKTAGRNIQVLIGLIIIAGLFLKAGFCLAACEPDSERYSPLTTYPSSCPENGYYQTVEWANLGKIGAPLPGREYVSMTGYQLTTGIVYNNARIEYTGMIYDTGSVSGSVLKRTSFTDDIFQGSYALMLNRQWGGYTGEVLVGIRWFENEVGEITEYYVTREFTKDNLSMIVGANFLNKSSGFHTRAGASIDARYKIAPNVSLFAQYNSADFFKNFANDYLVPYVYETPKTQIGCDACSQDSFAGGLFFNYHNGRGSGYLILTQMEEQMEPIIGTTFQF
ncbi:MAG: hypothetical protein WCX65_12265 [bacterium]